MTKILAVRKNNNSGGTFHRLFLPLSKMDAHFTTNLTEELVSKYDSLWIHYKCDIHPTQFSLWRLKYGFQIVLDIDDTWNIPLNHPSYDKVSVSAKYSKLFAIVADYVVCSTPEVEAMVKPYNENTIVVPNRIPYGEGQYHVRQESLESFMNRKIRVGFCGSISHMEDWMSIHGKLRRVLSDGEFKQKCEFVLCGVPDIDNIKPDWIGEKATQELRKRKWGEDKRGVVEKAILDSFRKQNRETWNQIAGNTKPKIFHSRPPENYIDLYREIDILLCPLVDNDLNRLKSDLKPLEAACTDTYCILSSLYKDKNPDLPYPYENWYENIKSLIKDKEKFFHLKNSTSEYVRGLSDYHKECVLPRQTILGKRRSIDLDIHGITYKEDQQTEYKPYLNTVKTISDKSYLFENNCILNLYNKLQGDYVGIFSWKFPNKTGLSKEMVYHLIKDETVDVISFCGQEFKAKDGRAFKYLEFTEIAHPGFMEGFNILCDYLGLKVQEPRCVIYSNFWVAKPEVYKEYVDTILIPAIEFLERPENKWFAWRDSGYQNKGGLKPELLKQYTGLDYYPLIVFMLERLVSVWIDNKNLSFKILNKI